MGQIYDVADVNNDGWVSVSEMRDLLGSNLAGYVNMPQVQKQINSTDKNRDGKISYAGE